MEYEKIRRTFSRLKETPFHPQWFAFRKEQDTLKMICSQMRGLVLDIGCADQKMRPFLSEDATYIGLDYYHTAVFWYKTRPQIYGDAQCLPFCDSSLHWVLMMNVLEHLSNADRCLDEVYRILTHGGKLVIHVPFMYPLHDKPLDFQRWTIYGLRVLAQSHGFRIIQETPKGRPLETAALLTNIALSKTLLHWISQKNPLSILVLLLPPIILCANVLAWLLSKIVPPDSIMPHGFSVTLMKD